MNISIFINKWKDLLNKQKEERHLTFFDHYEIVVTEGQKYFKVYRAEMAKDEQVTEGRKIHSSIIAFIDKTTGDIFKPATFNAPAKHARGNVNSPQDGMEAIDDQGFVRYLK